MTRSVYIIGGAGTGKSTFMAALLDGHDLEPIRDLHSKPNKKNVVVLRGHHVDGGEGLYLGRWRESFPGTDGLDRATSPCGAEWLEMGGALSYGFILGEGATLATRPFIRALAEHTDLLLVHLYAEDFVKELRFAERGSTQPDSFVTATATRALNLWSEMKAAGVSDLDVDSADPQRWGYALNRARKHLRIES